MTPFQMIDCLTIKKIKWEDLTETDQKGFSIYMTNLILSMHMDYTGVVNYLQRYNISFMTPKDAYKLYYDLLPKSKIWAKYIKNKGDDDKLSPDLIEFLSKQEKWSKDETKENIKIILKYDSKILKEYLKMYAISDSDIKTKFKIK